MEFKQVIETRRSIRAFTDRDVSDEQVLQLLEWAHAAPSGGNLRPWEYIVVRSQAQKEAIAAATFCGNDDRAPATQKWLAAAPVVVVAVGLPAKIEARYGKTCIPAQALLYQDCGAMIENFLLGAVALGLGSCYIAGFREKELSQTLGLPEEVIPVAILPLGHPAQPGVERPRSPVGSILHHETY
jgi:nitroreductase